jgi:hypothetical protein
MIFYELHGSPWNGSSPTFKAWYTDREVAQKACRKSKEMLGEVKPWNQPCVFRVEIDGPPTKGTVLSLLNCDRRAVIKSRDLIYPKDPEVEEYWDLLLTHRSFEVKP